MASNRRIEKRQRVQHEKNAKKDARFNKYYLCDFPAHLNQERSARMKAKG